MRMLDKRKVLKFHQYVQMLKFLMMKSHKMFHRLVKLRTKRMINLHLIIQSSLLAYGIQMNHKILDTFVMREHLNILNIN